MFEVEGERLLRSELRKGHVLGMEPAVTIVPVVFLFARRVDCLPFSSGSTPTSLAASRVDLLMMYAELFECLICAKKPVWKSLGEPRNKCISLSQYGTAISGSLTRVLTTSTEV